MDVGLTHLALAVRDLETSIHFWSSYADMRVVHSRVDDPAHPVAWLSDLTRRFVLVLLRHDDVRPLAGWAHVGVACESRHRVDRLAARARAEGHPVDGPTYYGPVTGYLAIVSDPDGHQLELSHGQNVGLALDVFAEPTR